MTRANDIGSSPANPVMDFSQNTATGETTGYQTCYSGLTIRQAYKIAALNGHLASMTSVGCNPKDAVSYAAACADEALAEDSEHEAALSGKGGV